jgi:hypothetical protein
MVMSRSGIEMLIKVATTDSVDHSGNVKIDEKLSIFPPCRQKRKIWSERSTITKSRLPEEQSAL